MAQPKIVVTAKIVFETVAFHEIGHALVAMALPGTDRVHKISIIPRGIRALGCTIQRPIEDRYLMARDEMECKVAVLLGGWAAEMLVFGKPSTGAADDRAKATGAARAMNVLAPARQVLDHGARLLLEKETLDESELSRLTEELGEAARGRNAMVHLPGPMAVVPNSTGTNLRITAALVSV